MKYLLIVNFLLLFHQSNLNAQRIIKYSDKIFLYTLIRDSVRYVDYMESKDSNVTQIIITRLKDNKVVQKIIPKEQFKSKWFGRNFEILDMNFDGFNDIRLFENGKGINQAYYAWLFNPVKEKFEPCEQLENITSPEVDDNKKLIYSNWKGGAGNFGSDIYEYKKGKYILMSSLELNRYVHKKDTILLTKKTLNPNGKILTVKKFYPEADFDKLLDSLENRKY